METGATTIACSSCGWASPEAQVGMKCQRKGPPFCGGLVGIVRAIPVVVRDPEPIHLWFSLSYANYLVLHRSMLQSMPEEWQQMFVDLIRELDSEFFHIEQASSYDIRPLKHSPERNNDAEFIEDEFEPVEPLVISDPVPHYDRGRTKIKRRSEIEEAEQS